MLNFIKKELEEKEKMKRRADILYPSMKIKDSSDNKKKFTGLGKSIFDNENNNENTVAKDYSSDKSSSKIEKKEKDYQKTADILYPTMKDKKDPELELIKQVFNEDNDSQIKNNPDKISTKIDKQENKTEMKQDKKEIKPEKQEETKSKPGEMKVPEKKQGDFTGGAANIEKNKKEKIKEIDNSIFSDNALKKTRKFIQNKESFSSVAYKPTKDDKWTIGYGHTEGVKEGDKITKEQAEELYKKDFEKHSHPLKLVKVPLSDNEKVALASLIYNIGPIAFKNSTLLKELNTGNKEKAANEFDKWIYKNGRKLDGLVNRRKAEKELFLTPDE